MHINQKLKAKLKQSEVWKDKRNKRSKPGKPSRSSKLKKPNKPRKPSCRTKCINFRTSLHTKCSLSTFSDCCIRYYLYGGLWKNECEWTHYCIRLPYSRPYREWACRAPELLKASHRIESKEANERMNWLFMKHLHSSRFRNVHCQETLQNLAKRCRSPVF